MSEQTDTTEVTDAVETEATVPAQAESPEAAPAPNPAPAPEAAPEPATVPVPVAEVPAPKPPRRALRAALRWTAAVLVCGGLGAGTAMGITAMERTDVPGLATESDGRWDYPKLSLPALPAGVPRPFTDGNDGEVHHADLRALLLPAPAGAKPDPKLTGGWVTTDQFFATYPKEALPGLKREVAETALRHVAARGWTAPDGTVTRVHLLRFNSVAFAEDFRDEALKTGVMGSMVLPTGVENWEDTEDLASEVKVPYVSAYGYDETVPYGAEQTRWSVIQAGDTLGVVTLSRKGGVATVPFQQTVALQAQLLG
ncbi:hypothetical protein [Streptomyces solicathayae]|uniref:Uncharacterized protein n=1 Tax=Streptomyces solicathayae TaxID=3081768 RepID=A0ABZ0LVK0_9ACTN|nr:hypothetical protein [Streptomyces sp. HUAS YS2]WOX23543.1 hypothetical protein R2D22_20010 [Streptomyces sp. HUAS YS2]